MKKLFLFDAYALIYRSYYAMIRAPRVNSKGVNTSAVYGFINTVEEVLRRENPTHVGVAFDPAGPTFRHEAYPQYKAQREAPPEDVHRSVPLIKQLLGAYRIPILEAPGYEADDVIGTLAKRFSKECPVFMMTPDKDYGQLVDASISIYKPKQGSSECEILDIHAINERYGLSDPLQMIDFLGLMGDVSDNIPGCPGVGEVTAKKLIATFGSIEHLLENTGQLTGSLRQKVEENREMITFSKFLATIKTDVPIDTRLDDLARQAIDEPALRKLFDELEFRQLSARVFGTPSAVPSPVKRSVVQTSLFDEPEPAAAIDETFSDLKDLRSTPHQYLLLDTDEKIEALTDKIHARRMICFDTETTGLDPFAAELVGMSFALQEGEAWYLPLPEESGQVRRALAPFKSLLEDPQIMKIGQNLKYDVNVLKKYGIRVEGPVFDTMIAHYLINPEYRHNMDYLAETYLRYRTVPIEDLIGGKGKGQISMRRVPLETIADYACEDADITLQLKNKFEKMIGEEPLRHLFYHVEMPLIQALGDMEEAGVRLDTEALHESSKALTQHLGEIEREVFTLAGEEFNISSPKIVGEVLFDHLKISDSSRKTKSGQYTTSEDVLESLTGKHPVVEKILKFRKIKKMLSTYIDALPGLVHPVDGKVHTTFHQSTTATGRLSSSNPNLQNIPIRDEEGRDIRRAFIPDPGCCFLSADYSQIELRILAHLSRDKNMLEAFRAGQDIHTATAAKIFGVSLSEVTREMRRTAKTANFGIVYGISTFGLAEQLRVSRTEARDLIEGYFATFPDLKDYILDAVSDARKKGYVETILGRRRFLPDINSRNAVVRGYAERNAVNAPIQGSAADIIKMAMNRIYRRFREERFQSRMIIQVHDELNFNVFPDELERVKQLVVYEMERAIDLRAPLVAECGVGQNWLEAHG